MTNLKQQFSDLRKNTPKHIQWLLLAAAFVVVLILLTLLLTHKEEEKLENAEEVAINLSIFPDTVDWANVTVGETESETIKISTDAPVKIMAVRTSENATGLSEKNTCTSLGQIDSNTSCTIELTYKPTLSADAHAAALFIDWRGATETDNMKKTEKVVIVLGAKKIQLPEPEPVSEPAPVFEEIKPVQEVVEQPSFKQEIKKDLETIAQTPSFVFEEPKKQETFVEAEPEYVRPSEACSDFAMPGYNLSGVQSGWIRPSGGAYYFHPFSDKECKNPTGVYNPDNGIITDINNPAQKIGTDAEHIGYTTIQNGTLPQLSNPATTKTVNKAVQLTTDQLIGANATAPSGNGFKRLVEPAPTDDVIIGTSGSAVFSSDPFDRKFVLRQYKPIPATIVSEVRADPSLYGCITNAQGQTECTGQTLPVRATVDRNVYADDGRTVVIPTGTLMLGYVTGELPGPYKSIGRMQINWYQFILPSGVEFNFNTANAPFSGDSQGRAGVPGHGSTDYVEQLVMPMLTAIVPAAVNMIAPIADTFINQIDLDNNTVVQSGTVRSSELAKQEVITAWNQVAQKLIVDALDNTIPPFSIAAGTRITVYSPQDLVITCGSGNSKECSIDTVKAATRLASEDTTRNERQDDWRQNKQVLPTVNYSDGSWTGQVRSFNLDNYCTNQTDDGMWDIDPNLTAKVIAESGYDYRTVLAYCQSLNYQAISNAQQDALYQNQQEQFQANYGTGSSFNTGTGLTGISGSQSYNENVLGLNYNDDGTIQNPFADNSSSTTETVETVITCDGGALPDEYGCCPGETYTDMGEQGFNCCPETGDDCFPPIL